MALRFPLALLAGLLVCAAIGFINGYVTIRFAIPSFITTLGMLFMARSLTVVVSGGFPPLLPADLPNWLFTSFVGPGNMFRMSFLWFAGDCGADLADAFAHQFRQLDQGHRRLPAGRRRDGHPDRRVKIICFVLCSMLSGFAGMMQVLRLGSPLPSIGEGLELQAVAAAVIGGASLAGGIGTVSAASSAPR